MFNTVNYEIEHDIAKIYLNRPERLNAVIPQLVEDLCLALDQSQKDGARVLILAGRGRSFCAGLDLKHVETPISEEEERRRVQRIQDVTRKIQKTPFPVIAAVHGYALGAGFEFALGCDLIFASKDAQFGFPEVSVGQSVTGGVSYILPNIVGLVKAKELLFLSERISADLAQRMGLINDVFEINELEEKVMKIAEKLRNLPLKALSLAKIALNNGIQSDLETAFEMEIKHALITSQSIEARQHADKFKNKSNK